MEGRQIRAVLAFVVICCVSFQIRASDPVRCSNQTRIYDLRASFLSFFFLSDCFLSGFDCRSFMSHSMSLSRGAGLLLRKTTIKVRSY